MNLNNQNIKCLIFIYLFTSGLKIYAQDTSQKLKIDTSNLIYVSSLEFPIFSNSSNYNYLTRSPQNLDTQNIENLNFLLNETPNEGNYEKYYSLGCSYWELGNINDAERIFSEIINSKDPFFTKNYYHSSDVNGETSKNIYGYGSFTTNYKNNAAIYLTRINLERKNYKNALKYLDLAVKKYKAEFTCGTGYHRQKDEYDFYYANCYEGLGENKKNIELLLTSDFYKNDEILIRALTKVYSKSEIIKNLKNGINSIQCKIDRKPSYGEETRYGANDKITTKFKYFTGTATIKIFNKTISISPPYSSPKILTKKDFQNEFKDSNFYKKLMDEN